jgi:hypothetical protein
MTASGFGRLTRRAFTCAAAALLIGFASTARAQTNIEPEEFTAFAVNMGSRTVGTTATLIFTVNRWTSEAEREKLFAGLKEKGQEALLNALQRTKRVGSLRTPESIGYDLRLATVEETKDGRRIILVTDRPVSFREATNRPQSIDYPFTVIEIFMPAEGKGKGQMSIAARIVPAGKTVIIENYDTAPVTLNNVESRKLKK